MYHSLIISGKNTYDEWGMVPTSRPVVDPPEVKENYADLPASHGVLDYTSVLLGETPYGQREGSWEFALRKGARWADTYSSVMNYLHGARHTVILEDDPSFQYAGRLAVNAWKSDEDYSLITIDYSLDPFKYSTRVSDDEDWKWDDLFVDYIRYGTFDVDGTKHRTFVNMGMRTAVPTFTCTAPMDVTFKGQVFRLMKGKNSNANLSFAPGDNLMVFSGNGRVTVSYREASL